MANTGFKGIDVLQTANEIVFTALCLNSSGAVLTSGTTFAIDELQSDGTLKSFDFNDHTFKASALTTATGAASEQKRNNNAVDTGLFTSVVSVLSGFTEGAVYVIWFYNSGASPPVQGRKFQFGSVEGDVAVAVVGSNRYIQADAEAWRGTAIHIPNYNGVPLVDANYIAGVAQDGAIPPTAGQILAAFQASADWQTMLANVNGVFAYNPVTGVLVLKDKTNTTTLATLTLTTDNDGTVTARASS